MLLFIGLSWTIEVSAADFTVTRIATNLLRPVWVVAPPCDHERLFIVEKRGVVRILNLNTLTVNPTPFLDIDSEVGWGDTDESERGLLSLVFHPNYDVNGVFYVHFIDNSNQTNVRSYVVSSNANVADATSSRFVFLIPQPFNHHKAGWMGFGPDGYLYIALGDGGASCDPGQRAQDITSQLLGKILRIDVDGADNIPRNNDDDAFPFDFATNYSVPPDNPFVGEVGDDPIYAYGLRNPWRCSFDRATGDLYIGDVGQAHAEEINLIAAGGGGGQNFGWDCREGSTCADKTPFCEGTPHGCTCPDEAFVDPIHEYPHSPFFYGAVIGGYVYRGCEIPSLKGQYLFADAVTNVISMMPAGGGAAVDITADVDPNPRDITDISSFGEGPDGELYIVELGLINFDPSRVGEIWKIVPSTPVSAADLDVDGSRDLNDADLLVSALLGESALDECVVRRADLNKDCALNGLDIQFWLDAP